MSNYIYTRDNFGGYDVEAAINSRASEGIKGVMTAAEVMCENVEESEGFEGVWAGWNDEMDTVKIGKSKGYAYYDAPGDVRSCSEIIANLMDYGVELESEIVFEKTTVRNMVFSDAAGCRVEATEFAADGSVVAAVDYVVVYWKGKSYKVNKNVAYGTDAKTGECIMGYEIAEEDLMKY